MLRGSGIEIQGHISNTSIYQEAGNNGWQIEATHSSQILIRSMSTP